ncbi:MAG TPA: hypothetical protein VEX39_04970 [Thermoleophilaceae bacterium]|nr:hypothetical protein [Thermoleophilaceae bacterium]
MAKRDKRLYKSLRSAGVRKRAARTAAEAARRGGEGGHRVLAAIAQELHEAGDLLDARTRAVEAERDGGDKADPDRHLRDAARQTAAEKV